ncbi:hypothetical protein BC828DRAFT_382616 [Blastocladiella britannica]|nr:hypothetical protein BC828DRAFT_382616 [Blastocladiella britannica]
MSRAMSRVAHGAQTRVGGGNIDTMCSGIPLHEQSLPTSRPTNPRLAVLVAWYWGVCSLEALDHGRGSASRTAHPSAIAHRRSHHVTLKRVELVGEVEARTILQDGNGHGHFFFGRCAGQNAFASRYYISTNTERHCLILGCTRGRWRVPGASECRRPVLHNNRHRKQIFQCWKGPFAVEQ